MEKATVTSVTGKPLCVRVWAIDAPRAVVQLVHGMAEHMDRYDRLAVALNAAGYAVIGHDHLGHGPTAPKEELGYFGPKDGWNHLIEDTHRVTEYARLRFPGLKIVLLGHSMGSFVVREYLLRYGKELAACILSGTGWHPAALCTAARSMAAASGAFGGWQKPAAMVNKMGFGSYNKAFQPARTDFDWLSRDEKEVDKYVADPLCGFTFTARGFYDMFDGLLALSKTERLTAIPDWLPIYFVSGDKDPVGGQNAEGVKTVAQQFRDAGVRDVTVKLYKNGRHETFNEINRDEATADLIAWIDSKLQ